MLPPCHLDCHLCAPPVVGTLGFSPDRPLRGDRLSGFSSVPGPCPDDVTRSCCGPVAGTLDQPCRSCSEGAFENSTLRRPDLNEIPCSRLHACLSGIGGGLDWSQDPSISSVGHCIARSADPALMPFLKCQVGPDFKLPDCAVLARRGQDRSKDPGISSQSASSANHTCLCPTIPFRVPGLLGEQFAIQHAVPDMPWPFPLERSSPWGDLHLQAFACRVPGLLGEEISLRENNRLIAFSHPCLLHCVPATTAGPGWSKDPSISLEEPCIAITAATQAIPAFSSQMSLTFWRTPVCSCCPLGCPGLPGCPCLRARSSWGAIYHVGCHPQNPEPCPSICHTAWSVC